jgi:hypothetical protein
MKIYIKKPFLTDAEKRAQDWVLRAKPMKESSPVCGKDSSSAAESDEEAANEILMSNPL